MNDGVSSSGEGHPDQGWGVFQTAPWHFAGLFPTQAEAEAEKRRLGNAFEFAYGSYAADTDEFIRSAVPSAEA